MQLRWRASAPLHDPRGKIPILDDISPNVTKSPPLEPVALGSGGTRGESLWRGRNYPAGLSRESPGNDDAQAHFPQYFDQRASLACIVHDQQAR